MKKKEFISEHSIAMLRKVEVLIVQGGTAVEASRKLGVTEQTYHRWKEEYGGIKVDRAKRFRERERENIRLKKFVADLFAGQCHLEGGLLGNLLRSG